MILSDEEFDHLFYNFKAEQRLPEFKMLIDEVGKLEPEVILEIGVRFGGSLKFWERIAKELVVGVDIDRSAPWSWLTFGDKVKIVIGDSTKESTKKEVNDILKGRKIDFLFVDGGHGCSPRYNDYIRIPCQDINNTPRRDFENFSPLVRSGGLVCIADLGEPCCRDTYDVLEGKKKRLVGQDEHGLWWKP